MVAQRDILQAANSDSNGTTGAAEHSTMAGLWCQSADVSGGALGSWLFPNNSQVPVAMTGGPLHALHLAGQIGLQWDDRTSGSSPPVNGMYSCNIRNEDGLPQLLVVWIGSDEVYDGLGINRKFC